MGNEICKILSESFKFNYSNYSDIQNLLIDICKGCFKFTSFGKTSSEKREKQLTNMILEHFKAAFVENRTIRSETVIFNDKSGDLPLIKQTSQDLSTNEIDQTEKLTNQAKLMINFVKI